MGLGVSAAAVRPVQAAPAAEIGKPQTLLLHLNTAALHPVIFIIQHFLTGLMLGFQMKMCLIWPLIYCHSNLLATQHYNPNYLHGYFDGQLLAGIRWQI